MLANGYYLTLGIIATAIGLSGYLPYFNDIIKRKVKPHAFSWLIWGLLGVVVFFAQTSKGAGAWRMGSRCACSS